MYNVDFTVTAMIKLNHVVKIKAKNKRVLSKRLVAPERVLFSFDRLTF